MTITLGGLELPAQTEWVDKFQWSPILQQSERTIGGRQVIWRSPVSKGRPITLVAATGVQRFTEAMVQDIQAMADEVNSSFQLSIDGVDYTVMFRHDEPPAFSAIPVRPLSGARLGFYATLKLMTI